MARPAHVPCWLARRQLRIASQDAIPARAATASNPCKCRSGTASPGERLRWSTRSRTNDRACAAGDVPHPCQNAPDRGDKTMYSGERKPPSTCVTEGRAGGCNDLESSRLRAAQARARAGHQACHIRATRSIMVAREQRGLSVTCVMAGSGDHGSAPPKQEASHSRCLPAGLVKAS
jgi:hypothetical protein